MGGSQGSEPLAADSERRPRPRGRFIRRHGRQGPVERFELEPPARKRIGAVQRINQENEIVRLPARMPLHLENMKLLMEDDGGNVGQCPRAVVPRRAVARKRRCDPCPVDLGPAVGDDGAVLAGKDEHIRPPVDGTEAFGRPAEPEEIRAPPVKDSRGDLPGIKAGPEPGFGAPVDFLHEGEHVPERRVGLWNPGARR